MHRAIWPRAAVFDCDGLLVASQACWHHAYAVVAGAHGRCLGDLDLDALAGASVATASLHLTAALGVPIPEEQMRRALHEGLAAHPPAPMAGAVALTGALASRMRLAVASNGPAGVVTGALSRFWPNGTFDAVVSAEETKAPKPAPDVYLEACRQVAVSPSDAIAFEDSVIGARAARAAGLVVIGVPSVPGAAMDVDMVVPRLDDPRLLEFLRVELATSARGRAARAR
jgi:HAD superfamily hydrolase (TIGR01509 family)